MSDYILPIAASQTPSQPSVPHQCLSVDQSPTQEPISENQRQSAAKKNRPGRGGRRPGAGAPKGNLNALKHGTYSRQFARLGALIAASPAMRESLFRLAGREEARGRKADELATYILSQIIARGIKRGRDRLILLPPTDDADSISQNTGFDEEKTKFHPRSNQRNGPSRHGPQGSIRK